MQKEMVVSDTSVHQYTSQNEHEQETVDHYFVRLCQVQRLTLFIPKQLPSNFAILNFMSQALQLVLASFC